MRTILSDNEVPPLRLIFTETAPLKIGVLPSVIVPIVDGEPGEIVPPLFTVTLPLIVPVPASVPPLTVTAPVPVPEPLVLFTDNVPAETVVPPL